MTRSDWIEKLLRILASITLALSIYWIFITPKSIEAVIAAVTSLSAFITIRINEKNAESAFQSNNPITSRWKQLRFSFERSEFIHPLILRDLQGWISDTGEQIVSINLFDSHKSNRYSAEISVTDSKKPTVKSEGSSYRYSYYHIGTSDSGIHIVHTSDWQGGSGVFHSILLLTLEEDRGLFLEEEFKERPRLLLTIRGLLPLGDRFLGQVIYHNSVLSIQAEEGHDSAFVDGLEVQIR